MLISCYKNNYHIKNLKYAKVISSLKCVFNTSVSMKICKLANKVLRFKGEVKKACFRLHLLLHNDYFKGHMACCQSLLDVWIMWGIFWRKRGK